MITPPLRSGSKKAVNIKAINRVAYLIADYTTSFRSNLEQKFIRKVATFIEDLHPFECHYFFVKNKLRLIL